MTHDAFAPIDVAAIRCRRGEIVGSLIATIRRFVSSKIAQKLSYTEIHSPVSKRLSAKLTRGLLTPGGLSHPAARLSPRSKL
jgi:hypothetical protein